MDGPIGNAGPANRNCIDCDAEYEIVFWARHFDLSHEQLLEIIANLGPRISDVTAQVALMKKPRLAAIINSA